ncbi:MAG: DHA2 family efflux MFS transporter permease subunit [Actinomycetota bacterium]|nr:DHA2 family efflux MFS transporter permease subunit [Actinomycetota bacterium]
MSVAPPVPAEPPASSDEVTPSPRLGLALVLLTGAQLMIILDATIVNIALPSVQRELNITSANLSWLVTIYAIAFGGLLLLGGRLGDVLGRRKIFISGVLLFAFASLLGGVAQAEWQLLAARALQGLGAAAAAPTALALVTTTFPAGPARNRAFAVFAAMSGAGAAVGLILGGALTEVSWRWTMFINVPIGLLIAYGALRVLTESPRQHGRFDLPGAFTATLGLVSLVYGLTQKGQQGSTWTEFGVLGPIAVGVVLLVAFLFIEFRARQPLLPVRIVADRTRGVSFVVMLIVGAAMFAMFFFLALFIQQVLGFTPLESGLAFLPFSVGIIVAAQIASILVARMDPRWIVGTGALIAGGAMLGFAQLEYDSTYAGHLLPWILAMSFGLGLVFIPITLTAVSRVEANDSGVGSAVLNTVQQVGGALGLAILGTVAANAAGERAAQLMAGAGSAPAPASAEAAAAAQEQFAHIVQTYGFTQAFIVAGSMLGVAAVLTFVGLNIRHEDLATDGADSAPITV